MTDFLAKLRARLAYGATLRPGRDWLLLLALWSVLFAGILAWNIWAFSTVSSGGTLGGAASSTPALFSQSSLDAIRAVFARRAQEELKYADGVYTFPDPAR